MGKDIAKHINKLSKNDILIEGNRFHMKEGFGPKGEYNITFRDMFLDADKNSGQGLKMFLKYVFGIQTSNLKANELRKIFLDKVEGSFSGKKLKSPRKISRKSSRKSPSRKSPRKGSRKVSQKSPRKGSRKVSRKALRKASRKSPRKGSRKASRKSPRKGSRKVSRKSPRKGSRKVSQKSPRKGSRKVSRKSPRKGSRKVSQKSPRKALKVRSRSRNSRKVRSVSLKSLTPREQKRLDTFNYYPKKFLNLLDKFFGKSVSYNPTKNTISGKTSSKKLSDLLEKGVPKTGKAITVTFSLEKGDKFKVTYSNDDIPVKREIISGNTGSSLIIMTWNFLLITKDI